MKKYFFYLTVFVVSLIILTGLNSCGKQEVPIQPNKEFASPNWKKDETGRYPFSMTAVVQINDSLNLIRSPNDELGAFINGECRGIGVVVSAGVKSMYNIIIQGTSTENSYITFKYYNSSSLNMYITATNFLPFKVDDGFGSPDAPQVLLLQVIK